MITTLLMSIALAAAGPVQPTSAADKERARAEIWAMEQAIYAGRQRGDPAPYFDNTAPDFGAWPPGLKAPRGPEARAERLKTLTPSQEKLTMEYVGFVMNGDAAVIYYRTHRTRSRDGAPVDERFETTHTWVRLGGRWRLMGGMARAATTAP